MNLRTLLVDFSTFKTELHSTSEAPAGIQIPPSPSPPACPGPGEASRVMGEDEEVVADTSGTQMPTHSIQNDGKLGGEVKSKEVGGDPWEPMDAQQAFLGPSLWNKRLPFDDHEFKLEYIELDQFLQENGIPVDPSVVDHGFLGGKQGLVHSALSPQQQPQHQLQHRDFSQNGNGCPPQLFSVGSQFMGTSSRGPSHPAGISHMRSLSSTNSSHASRSPSPCGSSSSSCLDTTPAVSPDSTQANAEMALGSIPGHEFDPRTRAFTDDELKPQPMIKKSRKQFVPDAQKDEKYWSRRKKNNMAAKRSRDARRVKENQIAMRAGFLEKENSVMKQELEAALKENEMLKDQLGRCRLEH